MKVKTGALAMDLDGTVFGQGQLDLDEVASIRALQESGVRVILSSGRNLHYVMGVARSLGTDGPLICEEGAVVYNPETHVRTLNGDLSNLGILKDNLKEWLPMYDIPTEADNDKEVILALDRKPRVDLDFFVKEVEEVLKKKGLVLNVTRSDEMINVMPAGVDKGVGLRKVLEILGINRDGVVAVGDAPNDLPLLREAGYAVAVANAHKTLKAEADYVSRHPDGEGVSELIHMIMKGSYN